MSKIPSVAGKTMLSLAPLLPYNRLVTFWGSTLISTFSVSRDARDFYGEGMFRVAPRFETKDLEKIFPAKYGIYDRHYVFKILLSKDKITQDLVNPASAGENLVRCTCPPLGDHPGQGF